MSRNDSNCVLNQIYANDFPSDWNNTSYGYCGISMPNQGLPYEKISHCCLDGGPVMISNGCLQYCHTRRDFENFWTCVENHVPNATREGVVCNDNGASGLGMSSALGMGALAFWVLVFKAIL